MINLLEENNCLIFGWNLTVRYPRLPVQEGSSIGYQNVAFQLSRTDIINFLNMFVALRAQLFYEDSSLLNFTSTASGRNHSLLNLLGSCKLFQKPQKTTFHLPKYYRQLFQIPSHGPCKIEEPFKEWKNDKDKVHWTNGYYREGNWNESGLQLRVGGRYSVPSLKFMWTGMCSKHSHRASYVRLTTL